MDALTEAIVRLLRRQEETERRLVRLEETLRLPPREVEPQPATFPAEHEPAAPAEAVPEMTPPARTPEPAPGFETRMGLMWINRIGVVTLILGAAFFFKYAVENQWIGETTRVLLGTFVGIAGLAFADRMWRRGHHIYAQGICGAGIGILYLSFYAAFSLYHLTTQATAFALMLLTTITAGALSLRYGAASIAFLGLLGGYLTPPLLSTGEHRLWFLFSYVLLLDAGAVSIARVRDWRILERLAFLATAFLYLTQLHRPVEPEEQLVDTVFALAYYALFAALNRRFLFAGAQLLAVISIAVILPSAPGTFIALALTLQLAGLVIADRRGWPLAAPTVFGAFWLSYAVWYPEHQTLHSLSAVFLFLTAAFLIFLAWTPWRTIGRRAAAGFQDLLLLALNAAFYFGASYGLLETAHRSTAGPLAFLLAVLHMALAYWLWKREERSALLAAGVAWSFLILAAPLQLTGYHVTIAWALEGAALVWIGTRLSERLAIPAAMAVFAMALVRLAIVDSRLFIAPEVYPLIANSRFLTFVVTAVSLWISANWIREGWQALVPYITGHVVMLWALSLEVVEWAARTASPVYVHSVESTSLSILLATYAVLLVSIGVATRTAVNRVLGLGLIALVIAKLYLYDVWFLGLFYRMAAFAALGVLLLVMSFLYSRFRVSLENWWHENRAR